MSAQRPVLRDRPGGAGRSVVAERLVMAGPVHANHPRVAHSHASLGYYRSGRATMEQSGTWEVGAGDVLVVPAGQSHRWVDADRPDLWGVSLCVPCLVATGHEPLLRPFERVRDGGAAVVPIPEERRGFLESIFEELALRTQDAPCTELEGAAQLGLLTLILAEVERASDRAGLEIASAQGVVSESLRFIERNCLRPLTLEDVAAAVGRTPAYVTTALSRATGRSAGSWITHGRLAEACRLLRSSDLRIEAIAERIGYADTTHFIRMFRRTYGATPAAWRSALLDAR